jgi:hypothetical protein
MAFSLLINSLLERILFKRNEVEETDETDQIELVIQSGETATL